MSDNSGVKLALVGLLGIVLGAGVTGIFNYLAYQGDLDAKMIELSVGVLRSKPVKETMPLREWAIDVIEKRAKFVFTREQRETLLDRELPFKGGAFSNGFSSAFDSGVNWDSGAKWDAPLPKSPDAK